MTKVDACAQNCDRHSCEVMMLYRVYSIPADFCKSEINWDGVAGNISKASGALRAFRSRLNIF